MYTSPSRNSRVSVDRRALMRAGTGVAALCAATDPPSGSGEREAARQQTGARTAPEPARGTVRNQSSQPAQIARRRTIEAAIRYQPYGASDHRASSPRKKRTATQAVANATTKPVAKSGRSSAES